MPMPLDFGNDLKAAATDAFKKCASLLGVASDVYESDEFMEITIVDSYEDKEKGVKRLIEKNQKILEEDSEAVE
jgi:predicted glycosyltransferase involved in capsule biosynthesis